MASLEVDVTVSMADCMMALMGKRIGTGQGCGLGHSLGRGLNRSMVSDCAVVWLWVGCCLAAGRPKLQLSPLAPFRRA